MDAHIRCTETSFLTVCLEKELVLKYFPSRSVPFNYLPRKCQFILFFKEDLGFSIRLC